MSCRIVNHTPFRAEQFLHADEEAGPETVLVVKGSWRLDTQPAAVPRLAPVALQAPIHRMPPLERLHDLIETLSLAPVQAEIVRAMPDTPWARHESDLTLPKPRFDLIVHAWANHPQGQPFQQVEAAVDFIDRQQPARSLIRLRAHAPRRWGVPLIGLGSLSARSLGTVQRVPLWRPFAFGGQALQSAGGRMAFEANPGGLGYQLTRDQAVQAPLPWVESLQHPMRSWRDTPDPVALGIVPGDHLPRRRLLGSFDPSWQAGRLPRLPADADARHRNAAPEALQLSESPRPGDRLVLRHMGDHPELHFTWPTLTLSAHPETPAGIRLPEHLLRWDTLVVDAAAQTATLVWRCRIPHRAPAPIRLIGLMARSMSPPA